MASTFQAAESSIYPPTLMDAQPRWDQWRDLFLSRVERPIPQVPCPPLSDTQKYHLGRSLAIFQLGESGEGRIAREIMVYHGPGITPAYRQALGLFVAEEARHGRILKCLLAALAMDPLQATWSNTVFTWGRRLMDIRFKLLVLMAAEVVGLSFYKLVSDGIQQGGFRMALEQICADEDDHLVFHADFFRAHIHTRADRVFFVMLWLLTCVAAIAFACFDHRKSLVALGIRKRLYLRRSFQHSLSALSYCLERESSSRRLERQSASAE